MNGKEIEDFLNASDQDFSADDDDEEYLPFAEPRPSSPESEEEGQNLPVQDELPVNNEESTIQRSFWLTKPIPSLGPSIDNDILRPQGSSNRNVLQGIFEYLGLDFWILLAEQTNIYSVQQRDHRSVKTDFKEMIKFSGVQLLMGTLKYPQARMYWSRELCLPLIRDTIPRDRFFELRNHLHLVDNPEDRQKNNDKLWKLRPMIDSILKKCHSLPRSQHLSIDEQMIPFSGRCEYRHYVPSKPTPLGLKNFVLAARDGVVLDFHLYVGSKTIPRDDMAALGLGGGIVKLLCRTIEGSCVLYTDRFFTSFKLAEYLNTNKKDFYLTGTVMTNRIGLVIKKFKADKEMTRGTWDEKTRNDDKVCVLKWKDTKAVHMLSTCVGSAVAGTCKRWCKIQKRKVDVAQPQCIRNYNMCMGGIDLCDRLIAYYKRSMRTKKWTVRVFNHFLDLVVVNCWIMYVRSCNVENVAPKDRRGLMQYRLDIGTAMAKYAGGQVEPSNSSGSSGGSRVLQRKEFLSQASEEPPKKKPRPVVPHPQIVVRQDEIDHLPVFKDDGFASKCRYPTCKSRCRTM